MENTELKTDKLLKYSNVEKIEYIDKYINGDYLFNTPVDIQNCIKEYCSNDDNKIEVFPFVWGMEYYNKSRGNIYFNNEELDVWVKECAKTLSNTPEVFKVIYCEMPGIFYEYLSNDMKNDFETALYMVQHSNSVIDTYNLLSEDIQKRVEIIDCVSIQMPEMLDKYHSDKFDNKEFMLERIDKNPKLFEKVSEELKNDLDIILTTMKNDGCSFDEYDWSYVDNNHLELIGDKYKKYYNKDLDREENLQNFKTVKDKEDLEKELLQGFKQNNTTNKTTRMKV